MSSVQWRDPTVWLTAALLTQTVAANALWWAAEHLGPRAGARIERGLVAARWLVLGVVPLAAVGLGVTPLWLSGWVRPVDVPLAALGACAAAAGGAVAVGWPLRAAGRVRAGRTTVPLASLSAGAADVVLHEAHWSFVRAGVVAAAPGWFALPGGSHVALGQAIVLVLLVLETWANPWLRGRAHNPPGAAAAARVGAATAASHLGWVLTGSAAAGLAAHAVVAMVGAVSGVDDGTAVSPSAATARLGEGVIGEIEPTVIG